MWQKKKTSEKVQGVWILFQGPVVHLNEQISLSGDNQVTHSAAGLSILFRKQTQGTWCFSACLHTVSVWAYFKANRRKLRNIEREDQTVKKKRNRLKNVYLNPSRCVQHSDGSIKNSKGPLHLQREVDVSCSYTNIQVAASLLCSPNYFKFGQCVFHLECL